MSLWPNQGWKHSLSNKCRPAQLSLMSLMDLQPEYTLPGWQLDVWSPPQPQWAGGRKVYRADDRLSYNESSLFAQQLVWGQHNKRLGAFFFCFIFFYFPPLLAYLPGVGKLTQDELHPLALTCLQGKIPSRRGWTSQSLSPLVISVLTDSGVSITMWICG